MGAWCDRVQAIQRAGRAGRTRPGMCFRLYTRRFFEEDMEEAAVPEIQRSSLLSAVLHLKSLPLNVDVLEFDFLDPPKVSKQQPSFEIQHDQQKSTIYAPHSLCTKVWLNAKVSRTPFG